MRRAEVLDHDFVYAGKAWVRVRIILVLLALCAFAAGCATFAKMGVTDSKEDRFTYWTRYYETRMGLTPAKIVFKEDPTGEGRCAWVDVELEIGTEGLDVPLEEEGLAVVREVVHYDLWQKGCRQPWKIAKHEQCHRRWMHPYYRHSTDPEVDHALKEAEADCCETEYYR